MKQNPVKQLDEAIFVKIDELKSNPNYEKVKEGLGQIDEEYKEPLKIISTLLFFMVPTIVLLIFISINNSAKTGIQVKKDIIRYAGEILGNQEMIQKTSRGALAPTAITSFSAFNSQVGQVISSTGVDLGKIQLSDFQTEDISNTVTKSMAMVRLNEITTSQLGSIINSLVVRKRMKISTLSFKRDNKKKLITGTMTLNHFGKRADEE